MSGHRARMGPRLRPFFCAGLIWGKSTGAGRCDSAGSDREDGMVEMITVVALEGLINGVLRRQPVTEGELPLTVQVLAELYGRMIYAGQGAVRLAALPQGVRGLLLSLAEEVDDGSAGSVGRSEDVKQYDE